MNSIETLSRPSFPVHVADRIAAAHASFRPVRLADSDPDPDELLRRVRSPRSAVAPVPSVDDLHVRALRLRDSVAWDERDLQPLAEYNEWVAGVAA